MTDTEYGHSSIRFRPRPDDSFRMHLLQVLDTVSLYREAEGLPHAVFAAAVPKNFNSTVQDLVNEIHDDDDAAVRSCMFLFVGVLLFFVVFCARSGCSSHLCQLADACSSGWTVSIHAACQDARHDDTELVAERIAS